MTFTELYEHIYTGEGNSQDKQAALEPVDRMAWQIYRVLAGRKGFDWWWNDIEDEDKNEIFDEFREIVRRGLAGV